MQTNMENILLVVMAINQYALMIRLLSFLKYTAKIKFTIL